MTTFPEGNGRSGLQRVGFQLFEGNELDRGRVRRLEIDGWRHSASQRLLITRRAKAPLVTRLETRESPFRMRGHQIVPLKDGIVEKFARYLHTNRVLPDVSGPVRQYPSRKKPVIGSRQQQRSSVPRTLVNMGDHSTWCSCRSGLSCCHQLGGTGFRTSVDPQLIQSRPIRMGRAEARPSELKQSEPLSCWLVPDSPKC